jgi:PAS domain S-box-containing protein
MSYYTETPRVPVVGSQSHREELYEAFSGPGSDVEERVARGLDVGTSYLGLPFGFLTRIEDGTQVVVTATGDHPLLRAGESCPIEEAYCRETVASEGPLAVQHAATSTAVSEAAFDRFDLGTYVGATVDVGDEVYGTVCFAGSEGREDGFSEAETMFVELFAELVGGALEQRDHERTLRERNDRLAREKRRFEGIADASFDVVFRVGPDGEFTYVSSAVERVLGYEPAELLGARFASFLADDAVEEAMTAYADALDGERVEGLDLDFLAEDGARAVLEVNATPITEDGSVVGVQGVGRDVTARRERERELRLKTRAMDEATMGITIADDRDADTSLVYANEGFERLTGYDTETLLGRNCRFLQGEATDDDPVARLREGVAAGDPVSTELVNYRADGTPFWNQVRINPVHDDDGDVARYLGFQTDVTERKRTDQLVRLLNRVLRHNLRNEMNVVHGLASHLRSEGDAGGSGDSALDPTTAGERIADTAERVVALSERARELERYARTERDPERLDPGSLLSDVASRYREEYPDGTVEVSVETDYGVCAGRELERAVAELVENALKHDPDDPRVRVTARTTTATGFDAEGSNETGSDADVAADGGAWVELTVADDGPGIAETEAAVIERGEEGRSNTARAWGCGSSTGSSPATAARARWRAVTTVPPSPSASPPSTRRRPSRTSRAAPPSSSGDQNRVPC